MYYICVPILLYTFPHTAMYVFSYYYMDYMVSLPLQVAQHHVCHAVTLLSLLKLHMCPHTPKYVSSGDEHDSGDGAEPCSQR